MVERIQRYAIYLVLAALALICGGLVASGLIGWIGAIFLLPLIAYGAILFVEFGLLRGTCARAALSPPSPVRLLVAWLRELAAGTRVFVWRQPFRSAAIADFLEPTVDSQRGLVFVHGFLCNRGVWNRWLGVCRAHGYSFSAVNLEPPFASIDVNVPIIEAAVAALERSTGLAPVLVAHSMGGLAVRAWLAGQDASAPARVHRVVTIATPHKGTWLARWSSAANGKQMAIESAWLQDLERQEQPGYSARFVCFWSDCDNIVFPSTNATLPGADNRFLPGTPHVAMVDHPRISRAVFEMLLVS